LTAFSLRVRRTGMCEFPSKVLTPIGIQFGDPDFLTRRDILSIGIQYLMFWPFFSLRMRRSDGISTSGPKVILAFFHHCQFYEKGLKFWLFGNISDNFWPHCHCACTEMTMHELQVKILTQPFDLFDSESHISSQGQYYCDLGIFRLIFFVE